MTKFAKTLMVLSLAVVAGLALTACDDSNILGSSSSFSLGNDG